MFIVAHVGGTTLTTHNNVYFLEFGRVIYPMKLIETLIYCFGYVLFSLDWIA
jgi:hypothetical protein